MRKVQVLELMTQFKEQNHRFKIKDPITFHKPNALIPRT